jgi:hypothetical protein
MGIDGIGKKAPPGAPPAAGTAGATRAQQTGKSFEVDPSDKSGAAARADEVKATAPTPLERLRAGEIDVRGYVDAKVQEATAHLGPMPPEKLEQIRATLRDRIGSDPLLVELVKKATGHLPPPPTED